MIASDNTSDYDITNTSTVIYWALILGMSIFIGLVVRNVYGLIIAIGLPIMALLMPLIDGIKDSIGGVVK